MFEILFIIYAFALLVLVICSVLNSLNDYTKQSDVFFGLVVSFLLSSILLVIAYYQGYHLAMQFERLFQILAMALLLYYSFLNSKTAKVF